MAAKKSAAAEEYDDDSRCYYDHLTSSLPIPGLFHDFALPAKLLRLARDRNDLPTDDVVFAEDNDGTIMDDVISNFYDLLDKVEAYLTDPSSSQQHHKSDATQQTKFLIEVEGLDGSGKTTLVKRLQEALPRTAVATKTPSRSLADIRPLWDKRGGILARAFYMISNYVLEYEIVNGYDDDDVFIIDRWFASTCGYTVARPPNDDKPNEEEEQRIPIAISDMPDEIFNWPSDLRLRPNILLVLQIDQSTRQKRVDNRATNTAATTAGNGEGEGAPSRFNPWDERLAKDTALGERILEALRRVRGPAEIYSINANNSIEDVTRQALDIVKLPMERHLNPQNYFASNPLGWWIYMGQKLHLCDESGKRMHHALWNLQVSYNNNSNVSGGSGPTIPILKTVGLDRIDSNFVYYWTASSSAFSPYNESESLLWASILCMGGTYPTEFQWRAEGYLKRVTEDECTLRGFSAPQSLVALVTACTKFSSTSDDDDDSKRRRRTPRPDAYDDAVDDARNVVGSVNSSGDVCMVRFVPIRIEVLRGGPSTRLPGYPQRWEWSRTRSSSDDTYASSDTDGSWTMRSLLPFGPTPTMSAMGFRDLTICIVGTHTSGKSTIGRKLAKVLGCRFDAELGEIERDADSLVEGGHLHGDGSSTTSFSASPDQEDWDDFLLKKECERDALFQVSKCSIRVVETWHVGNAAWYKLRQQKGNGVITDLERYKFAISKHQESSLVVVVQLMLASPSTMVRRREIDTDNRKRLPMQDEEKECNQLHIALQDDNLKKDMLDPLGLPLLQVDNSVDGDEAMEKVLMNVLSFVHKHLHCQVLLTSSE
jgi:thymidylate kinase